MSGTEANTVFLRLEGPLQAWGDASKLVIRRTMDAPTKSGVLGLVCCAMGIARGDASAALRRLDRLAFGVRIDAPGVRWWDYHTSGAGSGLMTAEGKVKITESTGEIETFVTRREYLADASFLAALHGDPDVIAEVADALASPTWSVYLGRRSCPPAVPVLARPGPGDIWSNPGRFDSLEQALSVPARRGCLSARNASDTAEALIEWRSDSDGDAAPAEAESWMDSPVAFDPPVHQARLVVRKSIPLSGGIEEPLQPIAPVRPRADYKDSEYRRRRRLRLDGDQGVCVFCKSAATTVQHVTYRRAGGREEQEDLRSMCRLCHDAVSMLEYGHGMGVDRIDPCEQRWREEILRTRGEIVRFRSIQTRRRHLSGPTREDGD